MEDPEQMGYIHLDRFLPVMSRIILQVLIIIISTILQVLIIIITAILQVLLIIITTIPL